MTKHSIINIIVSDMGSVIDQIECPNCKQDATLDFYYKTGEEYIFCHQCGYSLEYSIIDRTQNIATDNFQRKELLNPYGAYRYKSNTGIGNACGPLPTDEDYLYFKLQVIDNPEIVYASVSRYVDNMIVEEILVDRQ